MIIILTDDFSQHIFGVCLPKFAANSATTPRQFIPNQKSKFITSFINFRILWIMRQTNKISTHIFDGFHVGPMLFITHCCSNTGLFFMTMRTTNQQSFSIQVKRTMIFKLKPSETYFFVYTVSDLVFLG
ncbi:hypothetical protein D3C86_815020 [compost metagenome]